MGVSDLLKDAQGRRHHRRRVRLSSQSPSPTLVLTPGSRYFDNILKVCPSSVESVTVEPDGTWRSSDDQHGTALPKGPSAPASAAPSRSASAALPPPAPAKGKQRASEPLTIDSDDDDDDEQPKKKADVIDLTLDSDDDEAPPPPARRVVPPPAPPAQAYRDQLVAAQAKRAADAEATRKRVRGDLSGSSFFLFS